MSGKRTAEVEFIWAALGIPALGDDEDVAALGPERVREDADRAQVDIAVISRSLAGRGALEHSGLVQALLSTRAFGEAV